MTGPLERDDEDIAAVLAVLTALSAGQDEQPEASVSAWADPAQRLRRPLPAADTWWASARRQGATR